MEDKETIFDKMSDEQWSAIMNDLDMYEKDFDKWNKTPLPKIPYKKTEKKNVKC
jgi:hypothetical protein